ncbi:MAG: hypothetical protein IPG79_17115 [Saprospiraceae bacterium]|nr:hypothetical protein [Saprospiraceae bacterium]
MSRLYQLLYNHRRFEGIYNYIEYIKPNDLNSDANLVAVPFISATGLHINPSFQDL